MPQAIEAIYENGVFKPFKKVKLPEHYKVNLIISPEVTPPTKAQKKVLVPAGKHTEKLVGLSPIKRKNDPNEIFAQLIYRNE